MFHYYGPSARRSRDVSEYFVGDVLYLSCQQLERLRCAGWVWAEGNPVPRESGNRPFVILDFDPNTGEVELLELTGRSGRGRYRIEDADKIGGSRHWLETPSYANAADSRYRGPLANFLEADKTLYSVNPPCVSRVGMEELRRWLAQ